MIRWTGLITLILFFGCNTEDAPDCLKSSGDPVQKELFVEGFLRILVNENIELVVREGDEVKVIVESGENLINAIKAEIQGDRLVLTNENECNVLRKFNQTKVFVTTPMLTQIRTSSQFPVRSEGILTFPELSLVSEDFAEESAITSGDFEIEVASERLSITSNNISSFFISGQVNNLSVNFFSGIGRFEGAGLVAQNVTVFHRGTNKMIVNPQESLKGELRSTGDLISKNRPPIVEVEKFYRGELIF